MPVIKRLLFMTMCISMTLWGRDVLEHNGACTINWTEGTITCKGESAEGQSGFAAKRVAVVVAQRNLLEVVKGVRINSEVTIAQGLRSSDVITSRVEGVIKGAEVLEVKYDEAAGASTALVRIRIGSDLLKALLSDPTKVSWNERIGQFWSSFSLVPQLHASTYAQDEQKTLEKMMEDLRTAGNVKAEKYIGAILAEMKERRSSGILIDVSGVERFEKALIVRLVDKNGKEIYPAGKVSKATLTKRNTSVGYIFGMEDARRSTLVCHTPLEIKAAGVYRNKHSNIVLTPEQIKLFEQVDPDLVAQAKVILVLGD